MLSAVQSFSENGLKGYQPVGPETFFAGLSIIGTHLAPGYGKTHIVEE